MSERFPGPDQPDKARRGSQDELAEELDFHLAERTRRLVAQGLPLAEARAEARRRFGDLESVKARLQQQARRLRAQGRREALVNGILHDVRFALRQAVRRPLFTAVVLLSLTLGIGINTAVFSVLDAVVLEPLPYSNPQQLVRVWLSNPLQGIEKDITSYPNFIDWRSSSRKLQQMVAVDLNDVNLSGQGAPEEVRLAAVTEGFFDMLGVEPALGRVLSPKENQAGQHEVAVLSHGLWMRRFASDPAAVGQTLRINGRPFSLVGVMPEGFGYPERAQLWVPLAFTGGIEGLREARGALWLSVVGRLADGASLSEAQAEMSAVAHSLEDAYPGNQGMGVLLEPLKESVVGDLRSTLLLLMGAVAFVLLIACANLANLFLVRGTARRQELSLRSALGASRWRLARQALTESLLLGLGGGMCGLLAALIGIRGLLALVPSDLPRAANVSADASVLAFTLLLSLAAGLVFGLTPALASGGVNASAALGEAGRTWAGNRRVMRLGPILVAGQFALALVLLTGGGLMMRTLANLQQVDPGFRSQGVLSFQLRLPQERYPQPSDVQGFFRQLEERLAGLPGVESAGAVTSLFLSSLPQSSSIAVEGRPDLPEADRNFPVAYDAVTPAFFSTLGIEILQGRPVEERDGSSGAPPLAVVNQAMARRFFTHREPVGGRFTFGNPDSEDPGWIQVVGVVADARRSGLDQPARPAIYLPHGSYSTRKMTLVIRAQGDPLNLSGPIQGLLADLDPELPISHLRTLDQSLADSLARRRLLLQLLNLFAALAVALASVGIYGVLAFLTGLRRREFGVRLALGARSSELLRGVLRTALAYALPGLAAGMVAALWLGRFLQGELFGVSATDPWTLLLAAGILAAVALTASWVPARRTMRINPVDTLRTE